MTTMARRTRPPYRNEAQFALDDDEVVTARFKRSTMEAFPCDAREAYAIERMKRLRWIDRVAWVVAIGLMVALLTSPAWWPR